MTTWRDNWVLFAHPTDGSHEPLYEKLKSEGITPYEVIIYHDIRSLINAMGLTPNTSVIFHRTHHVKFLDDYLYTMKRIHGEA